MAHCRNRGAWAASSPGKQENQEDKKNRRRAASAGTKKRRAGLGRIFRGAELRGASCAAPLHRALHPWRRGGEAAGCARQQLARPPAHRSQREPGAHTTQSAAAPGGGRRGTPQRKVGSTRARGGVSDTMERRWQGETDGRAAPTAPARAAPPRADPAGRRPASAGSISQTDRRGALTAAVQRQRQRRAEGGGRRARAERDGGGRQCGEAAGAKRLGRHARGPHEMDASCTIEREVPAAPQLLLKRGPRVRIRSPQQNPPQPAPSTAGSRLYAMLPIIIRCWSRSRIDREVRSGRRGIRVGAPRMMRYRYCRGLGAVYPVTF